ncbi:hypothetical protein C8A05DRAFT_14377 [Staphylotrichum tortipilum]|uniref:DUF7905 domain-containing protein n=1 Tax=Staphylotrichum tortipilum TaxID=2831512 RepID=A0AAN6MPG6_9PEZI|nr:hypothetical protein C8A05DRAFT_14377 [Staphylotrichum longicolle]
MLRKVYTSGADQVLARPPPKLNVSVQVSWPSSLRGFKDVDPSDVDARAVFARIAKEHEAMIEVEDLDGLISITVKATNRAKAREILQVLRDQLLYRPGEDEVWRAHLIVRPPKDGGSSLATVLPPKEGTTGRRAIAVASKELIPIGSVSGLATMAKYRADLTKTLNHMAGILRYTPNGMRMKVRFGSLVLDEWRKDKPEYSLDELEALVRRAGTRSTAHMLNMVSESAAKRLMDLFSPTNKELPEIVRGFLEGEDGEPTRAYSLILETKNLHIESTLERVMGQEKRDQTQGRKKGPDYIIGPLVTHQLEKQHRAAEVVTVCPESDHDWAFEIRKTAAEQETRPSAPFKVEDLEKYIAFTGASLRGGFPNISIRNYLLDHFAVRRIHGKVSLRYTLGMNYTLEINFYHEWQRNSPAQQASAPPSTTASVMLYGDDWDNDMRSGVSTPRQWDNSFAKQFLRQSEDDEVPGDQPGKLADQLDHLLAWVEWIQKGLDGVDSKEKSKVMGKAA